MTTLVVIAKECLPGRVKTRLTPALTPEQAAERRRGRARRHPRRRRPASAPTGTCSVSTARAARRLAASRCCRRSPATSTSGSPRSSTPWTGRPCWSAWTPRRSRRAALAPCSPTDRRRRRLVRPRDRRRLLGARPRCPRRRADRRRARCRADTGALQRGGSRRRAARHGPAAAHRRRHRLERPRGRGARARHALRRPRPPPARGRRVTAVLPAPAGAGWFGQAAASPGPRRSAATARSTSSPARTGAGWPPSAGRTIRTPPTSPP